MKKVSVIVSVYNEQEILNAFFDRMIDVLENIGAPYELLFVNDGSSDRSDSLLKSFAALDPRVKVIRFSRNFGHEAAMLAGIDYASGDYLVCIDADLEKPPETIPRILEAMERGADVVVTRCTENPCRSPAKRACSRLFYKFLNRLSAMRFQEGASDFFGITRRVADLMRNSYREQGRYLRGFIQQVGFSRACVPYRSPGRFAGKSKYSFARLCALALQACISFSHTPLHLGFAAGGGALLAGLCCAASAVFGRAPGWIPWACFFCFLFSIQIFLLGIIGEYIGDIQREEKRRPLYIVQETRNLETVSAGREEEIPHACVGF